MSSRGAVCALALAAGLGACSDQPTAPQLAPDAGPAQQQFERGTGIVLNDTLTTNLPLVGEVPVNFDVVITELALNAVGGLEATGTITGTADALGVVIEDDFVADVAISRGGPGGGCSVLTLDLAPIEVDALGEIAEVDLSPAELAVRGTGPVGSLLCALTGLIDRGVGGAVGGILNAINRLL